MWDHEERDVEDSKAEGDNNEVVDNRLFTLEITQTDEQEESVVFRPGFLVCDWSPHVVMPLIPLDFED